MRITDGRQSDRTLQRIMPMRKTIVPVEVEKKQKYSLHMLACVTTFMPIFFILFWFYR